MDDREYKALVNRLENIQNKQRDGMDAVQKKMSENHSETQRILGRLEAHREDDAEHTRAVSKKADDIRDESQDRDMAINISVAKHKDNMSAHGIGVYKWVVGIGFSLVAVIGTVVAMAR